MKRFKLPAILLGVWLLLWAMGIGVLVWSAPSQYDWNTRDCSYLIGVSVVHKARHGDRCPLIDSV